VRVPGIGLMTVTKHLVYTAIGFSINGWVLGDEFKLLICLPQGLQEGRGVEDNPGSNGNKKLSAFFPTLNRDERSAAIAILAGGR
jgi:hypothetical protein